YIHVEDGVRLQRALNRENTQKNPKYAEMCRRFLADEKDFSKENLKRLNITDKIVNDSVENALREIALRIKSGR
ncbi:MAG: guanylate kinase, partial [Eubacterium sp.]|nr:guanylate kinase [Eubacterium sp.]